MNRLASKLLLALPMLLGCVAEHELETEHGPFNAQTDLAQQREALVQTIVNDGTISIPLGRGRNSITEEWKERCVDGPVITSTQLATSSLYFNRSMTESEVNDSLSLGFSGKGQLGLFKPSWQAKFTRSTMSSQRSINMVFANQVVINSLVLDTTRVKWLVPKTDPAWASRCGDTYTQELKQGGEVYILVRLDFASESEKRAYEVSFGGSAGPFEVLQQVSKASSSLSGRATMTLQAFQRGGATQNLGGVLGGQDKAEEGLTCSLNKLDACTTFLFNAVAYATNHRATDFPETVDDFPAVTEFVLEDWRQLNVGPTVQDVPLAVLWTRAALALKLQMQLDIQNRARALRRSNYFGAPPSWVTRAQQYESNAQGNVAALELQIKKCYDSLSSPPTNAQVTTCADANKDAALAALGYKDLSKWVSDLDLPLPQSTFQGRSDYVTQVTPGVGFWGAWSSWLMCPAGTHVTGYKQHVKSPCGSGCDDTGLNAVAIVCDNWERTKTFRSDDGVSGIEGQWFPEASCLHGPVAGMEIFVEPQQGDADDTGANKVTAQCLSGETIEAPGGTPWGQPGGVTLCPAGTAVCGMQIRFEVPLPVFLQDNTTMNGLNLACCAY